MAASGKEIYVRLDGALMVPQAEDIQAKLLTALEGDAPIVLDLSEATEMDISFLQILVAAQKSAVASHKSLAILETGTELLSETAARCGLAMASDGGRILPPFC